MRKKIQSQSSGKESRQKTPVGIIQVSQKADTSMSYHIHTEIENPECQSTRSSDRTGNSNGTGRYNELFRFRLSLTPRGILLMFLWVYRKSFSLWLPNSCRFYPSCSAYAVEAIGVHGAVKGSALTAWRLLRCQPFCAGGYDPVPEKGRWSNKLKTRKLENSQTGKAAG